MTTILPGEYLDTSQGENITTAPVMRCTLEQLNTAPPDNIEQSNWGCNTEGWETVYNENTINSYKELEDPITPPENYRSQYFNDDRILIGERDNISFDTSSFTDLSQDARLKTLQFAKYVVDKGMPISPADREHLYRDFNVCGPSKWYSATRENSPVTAPLYSANQCNPCPTIDNNIFTDNDDKDSHYSQNAFDDMFEQCFTGSETGPESDREYAPLTQWFPNQLERNMNAQEIAASGDLLGAERGNIDWANWSNDESVSNNWSSRVGPVPNSELERELMILYPELDYTGLTCLNGQPCGSLNDVKLKIFSDLRISDTDCSGLTWSTGEAVCSSDTTFGENPQAIVPEMVRQWTREQLQNPATHLRGAGMDDFVNSFFSGQAQNPEFEMCINNIFETNEEDRRILRRIKGYSSGLLEFTDDDIEYVRRKMLKFIFAPRSQVANCLDDLYINANQICTDGLTDKMSKVAFVLFYIVGIKIDLADLDSNDEKREKMGLLMDKLGPLVPQLIKRIIEVSKYEESLRCGGDPTNNTLLMERLFDDIFVKSGQDVNVDLGIDMDYFLSMTNQEFGKFVVVAGLGLKYLTTFFAL